MMWKRIEKICIFLVGMSVGVAIFNICLVAGW